MATPFDTPVQSQPVGDLATANQLLRAIQPMLADRDWKSAPDAWSARCAAISTVLTVVTDPRYTPTKLSDQLTGEVAHDFALVMAECAKTAEPGYARDWKPLTKSGASTLITWLGQQQWATRGVSRVEEANVAAAKASVAADRDEDVEGFWMMDGEVYKVQIAVHGSGFPYAKKLNPETGKFEMASGAIRSLRTRGHKMTKDEAVEFGHLYGICARCGRTLTDENSIEAGIGPVCAAAEW